MPTSQQRPVCATWFTPHVIQCFEFSYELAWKTLRRALIAQQGASALTGVDKAELFRVAARQGWLNSPQKWLDYNAARNMTSHAYDRVIAEDIYAIAVEFLSEVRILENHLRQRGNDDGA